MMRAFYQIRHAFAARLSEWQGATMLCLWGFALLFPSSAAMYNGPFFLAFRAVISQNHLGTLCLVGGGLRLLILAANGTWRSMYYARAWMALTTFTVWMAISLGLFGSGQFGVWIAVYPVLAIFDAVNMFRATADAANYEIARRAADGGSVRDGIPLGVS